MGFEKNLGGQKEYTALKLLRQVCDILHIPIQATQYFNEEKAVNIFSNTFNQGAFQLFGYTPTLYLNSKEKCLQLHQEKIPLYEWLLKEKEEIMKRLEKVLGKSVG